MTTRKPWTMQSLHKRMLKLVQHKEVSIKFSKLMNKSADVVWDDIFPPTNIQIRIDKNSFSTESNYIAAVIHEVLHVILFEIFYRYMDDDVEEIVILALESAFETYINKKPSRLKAWQKVIEDKLKEQEEKEL